jgi:hypothetical protein
MGVGSGRWQEGEQKNLEPLSALTEVRFFVSDGLAHKSIGFGYEACLWRPSRFPEEDPRSALELEFGFNLPLV